MSKGPRARQLMMDLKPPKLAVVEPSAGERHIADFLKSFAWSATSLGQFLDCPRAFWWERIRRQPAPKPWYFPFGSAVHKTVEAAHKGAGGARGKFQPTPERPFFFKTPESIAAHWRWRWRHEVEQAGEVVWAYENQRWVLRELGKTLLCGGWIGDGEQQRRLTGFWQRAQLLPQELGPVQIKAVEYPLKPSVVKLFGRFPIRGFIDQIWKLPEEGVIAVVDLTTSRSKAVVKHLQMALYLEALRGLLERDPQARKVIGTGKLRGYVWNLYHDKVTPIEGWDAGRLEEQLDSAHQRLLEQDFAPADNDYTCQHCRYRLACRGEPLEPLHFDEEPEEPSQLANLVSEPAKHIVTCMCGADCEWRNMGKLGRRAVCPHCGIIG